MVSEALDRGDHDLSRVRGLEEAIPEIDQELLSATGEDVIHRARLPWLVRLRSFAWVVQPQAGKRILSAGSL